MRGEDPRRRDSLRAKLVALLCVTGQLVTATHLVVVRHAACPEHGEFVHGAAEHGGHAAPQQAFSESAVFRAATTADDGHDHEHCSVPNERRKQALTAASHVLAGPEPGTRASFTRFHRAQCGVELLSLAPKQSPPAV